MKATELMIGDWVIEKDRVCRVSFNTTIEEVRKEDCATSASSSTRYYDIEPIPLTQEILEKNGFGFIDTSNDEYSSGWTGWWILEGIELGCCDNSKFPVFFNIADINVKVNYVHELQHALRLCGIEKEIVL